MQGAEVGTQPAAGETTRTRGAGGGCFLGDYAEQCPADPGRRWSTTGRATWFWGTSEASNRSSLHAGMRPVAGVEPACRLRRGQAVRTHGGSWGGSPREPSTLAVIHAGWHLGTGTWREPHRPSRISRPARGHECIFNLRIAANGRRFGGRKRKGGWEIAGTIVIIRAVETRLPEPSSRSAPRRVLPLAWIIISPERNPGGSRSTERWQR